MKLKNQLALINTLSKILIILIAVFILPLLVRRISINETDNQLIDKLDQIYGILEDDGVEVFIDIESDILGYGSYNILKEEYVSIEVSTDTLLYEYIETTQRIIDDEILNYRVISATFEYDSGTYLVEIGHSISSIINFEKELREFAFYLLILLLTLTIILDLSIVQILLRPFEQIIQKLKTNHHPSSFDYTKVKSSTSDFKYLEDSIHQLMKKIEIAFNEEREYIGNISHEILTPISIIRSKLDNFSENTTLIHEHSLKIHEVKITLGRLTKLVRSLLLLSRIENNEYLVNKNLNINQHIKIVLEEINERFEVKGISVSTDLPASEYILKGNAELMHILFFNLLNNAAKYTNEDGCVIIKSYERYNQHIVEISDDGVGIAEDHLPSIFSRFKKFQKGNNSFGLGLALVKKICDIHQIDIVVKSQPNKGSTFKLIFPKL
ncbi:MAG: HAMP domain-containing histidine kinase [Bacteroidetes bacterium]|nr:HAMP domain-containing histidine kinase [Bacteroidota bacterium]